MTGAAQAVRLEGAPPEYALPAERPSAAEAQTWCRRLATTHYENFQVATWFLPKRIRPYFESVYAFSRTADDLGDEVADRGTATRLLGDWEWLLDECYEHPERSVHPVYVALQRTIRETGVPRQLFADLIHAFQWDQEVSRWPTEASLAEYSRLSANPVGRIVLWVAGYRDEERGRLSDKVCTALQLINFWQDVVEDLQDRDRRYIPVEAMERHGCSDADIRERRFTPAFRSMMQELCDHAGAMLREGSSIPQTVDRELAVVLRLFVRGGEEALAGIVRQGYDTLHRRPSVSKGTKVKLLGEALVGKTAGLLLPHSRSRHVPVSQG